MPEELSSRLVKHAILFTCGILCIALGLWLRRRNRKYGPDTVTAGSILSPILGVGGLGLILYGGFFFVHEMRRPPEVTGVFGVGDDDAADKLLEWSTVTSPDGIFSVEMPGKPLFGSRTVETDGGPAIFHEHSLLIRKDKFKYSLLVSPNSFLKEEGSPEKQIIALRAFYTPTLRSVIPSVKLQTVEDIFLNGLKGSRFYSTCYEGDETIISTVFIIGQQVYHAKVQCPTWQKDSKVVQRFLSSTRITMPDQVK